MTARKQREVEAALAAKGFRRAEGDHSYFAFHRSDDGKKTAVFTKTSHGNSEIGADLISKMSKQVRLSKSEFLELVDCTLGREGYEELLRQRGVI